MVSLRAVVAALTISAVSGQGKGPGGEPDLAQLMEMFKGMGKGEEDVAKVMEMIKSKGASEKAELLGKGMTTTTTTTQIKIKTTTGKPPKAETTGKGNSGAKDKRPEMSVMKARSMMEEILRALNKPSALKAFAAVTAKGPGRMAKIVPMADKFAKAILKKYDFAKGSDGSGGLQRAVVAAMGAQGGRGQVDSKIRSAIEDIEEVISGQPAENRLGRLPALDKLAEKFRSMDAAARMSAIAKAKDTPGGELYAETMTSIEEWGHTHVVDAVDDLAKTRSTADNKTDWKVRMNIFQMFLGTGDGEESPDVHGEEL